MSLPKQFFRFTTAVRVKKLENTDVGALLEISRELLFIYVHFFCDLIKGKGTIEILFKKGDDLFCPSKGAGLFFCVLLRHGIVVAEIQNEF